MTVKHYQTGFILCSEALRMPEKIHDYLQDYYFKSSCRQDCHT